MLRVESLSKTYLIFESPWARMRHLLLPGGQVGTHHALSEVSFELTPGQCLGVVGDNGAGKSTLLKLVAGTIKPTRGRVVREGRLTAILELGAGFHPEFSGRENLRFAAALIGIPPDEMQMRETAILDFAEIGDAIDRPVKTYSSGMVVRLAFALVTSVDPDILIIDEALAVGDQNFQRKCIERIEAFRRRGCTILFCSHSMYHVRRLCDRALWIDSGRMREYGDTESVLMRYEAWVRARADNLGKPTQQDGSLPGTRVAVDAGRGAARLEGVVIENLGDGDPPRLIGGDLVVTLRARMPEDEEPALAILLQRADGLGITAVGTHNDGARPVRQPDGSWQARVRFPDIPLYSGEYMISGYLFDAAGVAVYDEWKHCARFLHVFPTLEIGVARLPHEWS